LTFLSLIFSPCKDRSNKHFSLAPIYLVVSFRRLTLNNFIFVWVHDRAVSRFVDQLISRLVLATASSKIFLLMIIECLELVHRLCVKITLLSSLNGGVKSGEIVIRFPRRIWLGIGLMVIFLCRLLDWRCVRIWK
jgi:hypothetical protein